MEGGGHGSGGGASACYLAYRMGQRGSEELRKDVLLFMAVQKQLGAVLNGFSGLIKNL